jgi:hypothetical protein
MLEDLLFENTVHVTGQPCTKGAYLNLHLHLLDTPQHRLRRDLVRCEHRRQWVEKIDPPPYHMIAC